MNKILKMGGGDLNLKKSWHPKTLKNQEKVWKAEQQQKAEEKKIAELQWAIKEEKDREQLVRVGEESGSLVKSEDAKLNWMYKGPGGDVSREEYLLGRKIDKSFELLQKSEQADSNNTNESGTKSCHVIEHDVNPRSVIRRDESNVQVDMKRKLFEDPLLFIRKKEEDTKTAITSNPVKMQQIQTLMESLKKKKKKKKGKKSKVSATIKAKKKKSKKAKKQKSKSKKKRKKKESSTSSSSSDSEDDSDPMVRKQKLLQELLKLEEEARPASKRSMNREETRPVQIDKRHDDRFDPRRNQREFRSSPDVHVGQISPGSDPHSRKGREMHKPPFHRSDFPPSYEYRRHGGHVDRRDRGHIERLDAEHLDRRGGGHEDWRDGRHKDRLDSEHVDRRSGGQPFRHVEEHLDRRDRGHLDRRGGERIGRHDAHRNDFFEHRDDSHGRRTYSHDVRIREDPRVRNNRDDYNRHENYGNMRRFTERNRDSNSGGGSRDRQRVRENSREDHRINRAIGVDKQRRVSGRKESILEDHEGNRKNERRNRSNEGGSWNEIRRYSSGSKMIGTQKRTGSISSESSSSEEENEKVGDQYRASYRERNRQKSREQRSGSENNPVRKNKDIVKKGRNRSESSDSCSEDNKRKRDTQKTTNKTRNERRIKEEISVSQQNIVSEYRKNISRNSEVSSSSESSSEGETEKNIPQQKGRKYKTKNKDNGRMNNSGNINRTNIDESSSSSSSSSSSNSSCCSSDEEIDRKKSNNERSNGRVNKTKTRSESDGSNDIGKRVSLGNRKNERENRNRRSPIKEIKSPSDDRRGKEMNKRNDDRNTSNNNREKRQDEDENRGRDKDNKRRCTKTNDEECVGHIPGNKLDNSSKERTNIKSHKSRSQEADFHGKRKMSSSSSSNEEESDDGRHTRNKKFSDDHIRGDNLNVDMSRTDIKGHKSKSRGGDLPPGKRKRSSISDGDDKSPEVINRRNVRNDSKDDLMERRRNEMMQNAAKRDQERKANIDRVAELERREREEDDALRATAIRRIGSSSVSSSMESRIKSKVGSSQRKNGHMDRNFLKK